MALINKLNNLGDSIRAKTGLTELLTIDEMAEAVDGIEGAEPLPEEAFSFSMWDGENAFHRGNWDWFIERYGDKITTGDLYSCSRMFYYSTAEEIPFDINLTSSGSVPNLGYMFYQCSNLKSLPNINIATPLKIPTSGYSMVDITEMFSSCKNLREIPYDYLDTFVADGYWEAREALKATGKQNCFKECFSLRNMPNVLPFANYGGTGYYNSAYNQLFYRCHAMDEITDLIVEPMAYTSNAFRNTFEGCSRVKNITFETNEDGSPIAINWKNQTIDLNALPTNTTAGMILNYNSGITADKEVKDAVSYEALKNDDDWFTTKLDYWRYNRTSAVATINSLPDVSAGSGNTIKFKGAAGALTDGGAINTMTEEEIAVATAKGWTVSYV
jgi:hypothetical protein